MNIIRHIGENNRPYTYSRRWRMKFNIGRFATGKMYRRASTNPLTDTTNTLRSFFWTNRSNFRYDEYWNQFTSQDTGYYLRNLTPADPTNYAGRYPFREIPATIVTHDIGNGESDFQLDKIILDAQYDTRSYGYNVLVGGVYQQQAYIYNPVTNPDPSLVVELRNTSYQGELPTQTINVIAANHAAVPGINPWVSRNNTPGTITTETSQENTRIARESLALVVPFAKYRRCRAYIETMHKMTTVRSLQLFSTEFVRRTYA